MVGLNANPVHRVRVPALEQPRGATGVVKETIGKGDAWVQQHRKGLPVVRPNLIISVGGEQVEQESFLGVLPRLAPHERRVVVVDKAVPNDQIGVFVHRRNIAMPRGQLQHGQACLQGRNAVVFSEPVGVDGFDSPLAQVDHFRCGERLLRALFWARTHHKLRWAMMAGHHPKYSP